MPFLAPSAEMYRQVAEFLPQFIWITGADGALEYVNQRWADYSGLDLVGTTDSEQLAHAFHPDERDEMFRRWQMSVASGEPYEMEARLRRRDGAFRWFLIRTVPLRDGAGDIVRWFGASTDIHEQKQNEADTALLAELSERIRVSEDAEDLLWTVARMAGEHLEVSRCFFTELDEDADRWTVHRDFRRSAETPSLTGVHPLSAYPPEVLAAGRAGRAVVVTDTAADPLTAHFYGATYEPAGNRAFVIVPLLRDGRWVSALAVVAGAPREWTPREVALLETLGERAWNAVEKLRLDASLRASEAKLQAALDGGGLGVWSWDPSTNLTTSDRRVLELFGLDGAGPTFDAAAVFGRVHPDDLPRVGEGLRQALQPGGQFYDEFRVVLPGGQVRWLAGAGHVPRQADGGLVVYGVNFDVTERKRAELHARFLLELDAALAPLADAEEIEQTAVERLGAYLGVDSCYFAQITGSCAAIHREYRSGGTGGTGLVGEYGLESYFSPDALEQFLQGVPVIVEDVAADPRTETDLFTALGIGAVISTPVKYHDRWVGALNCVSRASRAWRADEASLMQDLAARVWPLMQQARAAQALREADRRKDEFLAMLAHELRNPLAPIRNAAHVLKLAGPAEDPRQRWAREVIERQTQHLTRLVDDLLDVSRITQGKVALVREPLDIATLLHLAVETSRPLIEARHHRLTVVPPAHPVRIAGDRTRLVQVVGNLLNNAAKYTPEGGHIELEAAQEGGEAVIRVRDDGIGVPADLLPHVFDLFTQADRSLDRSQGGLGIGLTLVRQLVHLHGGQVEARSGGSGLGSEFTVRLPAAATEAQAPLHALAPSIS